MSITKDRIAQLKAMRHKNNARLEYHIDGPLRTKVISSQAAELENEILKAERVLESAHEHVETSFTFASKEGVAKVSFNHKAGEPAMNFNEKPSVVRTSPPLEAEDCTETIQDNRAMRDAYRDMLRERELKRSIEQKPNFSPKL